MFWKKIIILFTRLLILITITTAACTTTPTPLVNPQIEISNTQMEELIQTPSLMPITDEIPKKAATSWGVEVVAEGLTVPWSVVFPSEKRILVSERTGSVREIINGMLELEPLYVFEEVVSREEAGLMGIALHPQYSSNKYLYACYTAAKNADLVTRIVRLVDEGDTFTFDRIIIDDIPAAQYHTGCRIKFGPDRMLYITIGDALQPVLAQDLSSLAGKILRIDPEGKIPADNPFPDSLVYSYGHRNPQGIDWDTKRGWMLSSEHGPSGFDGPPGGDELNLIIAGGNYGWPLVSHDETLNGTIAPLIQFTPAVAPGSALFYASDALPFFTGSLFFGALRGEGVFRVEIVEHATGKLIVEHAEKIISDVGRVRDVIEGPDGSIYFTTSNRDGRGQAREGDDKIYRIFPVYD